MNVQSLNVQSLMDAMDGIALLLDERLCIAMVGWPNWDRFLKENDAAALPHARVLGRPFPDFLVEGEVRETYAGLLREVRDGRRPEVRLDYRCDAPERARLMRLSVIPVGSVRGGPWLLYQSILLEERQRPPIRLWRAPVRPLAAGQILTVCSVCARVAWPKGAPAEARTWIDAEEYERRSPEAPDAVSHGFCPECLERVLREVA